MANGQFGGGDGSVNNPRDYLLEFRVGTIDCLALGDIDVTDQAIRLIKGETEYIIPTQVVYAETASLTGVFFAPIDDSLYVTYIESLQFEPDGPYGSYYIDGENLGDLRHHKVPETGDNSITFVISSVSLDDLWRDESLLDSAYIKAFGVRFLNEPPIDEGKPFEFKVKSSLSVKAEITWNVLNGDVIYIVDPSTLARRLLIKNVINPLISEQINAHYTFSFDTVFDDKTKYINIANIIEVDDDYFQVGRIVKKRETSVTMSVSCEHVSYKLLDKRKYPMPFEDTEDTPRNIMSALLENTGFTIGTVEIDSSIYYIKPNSDNIRGALIELANLVGGELIWNKFTVSLVKQRGQYKGLEFKLGENLIGVTEEIDATGDVPRHALEVDVLDLARLPGYEYLKTVELGDTVRTYDPELAVDETLRIVSRDYNPFQKVNPRVSIGNVIRDITTYLRDTLKEEKEIDQETPNTNYWLSEFRIGDIDCLNLDGVLMQSADDEPTAVVEYVTDTQYHGLYLELKQEYENAEITVIQEHPEYGRMEGNWDDVKDYAPNVVLPLGLTILVFKITHGNETQVFGVKFVQGEPEPISVPPLMYGLIEGSGSVKQLDNGVYYVTVKVYNNTEMIQQQLLNQEIISDTDFQNMMLPCDYNLVDILTDAWSDDEHIVQITHGLVTNIIRVRKGSRG